MSDPAKWGDLSKNLRDDPKIVRAFYLAIAPDLFGPTCDYIKKQGYYRRDARVVIEKPLGHDLQSSIEINSEVSKIFAEDQVYRIDHYLGKETVQNLLALRFANILFEPVWNSAHIDHVQITVAESVGAGTRGYYDESGALRDMVQNHMLQLLCLVAMEPPASDDANALRDEKLKVLRSLKPIAGADVGKVTVRGQYRSGSIDGQVVASYQDELPADRKGSRMETFVALKAEIENWRWAGVPFYFRTGKRLASRASEIVIQFRNIPHSIFDHAEGAPAAQPADHPHPARRGREAADDDQGPGPGRHAPARSAAQSELRGDLQRAHAGGLRAPAARRDPRQPDAVHAPRRTRGGLEVDRPDPRGLGRGDRPAASLSCGHLGSVRRGGADRARRTHLARGQTR